MSMGKECLFFEAQARKSTVQVSYTGEGNRDASDRNLLKGEKRLTERTAGCKHGKEKILESTMQSRVDPLILEHDLGDTDITTDHMAVINEKNEDLQEIVVDVCPSDVEKKHYFFGQISGHADSVLFSKQSTWKRINRAGKVGNKKENLMGGKRKESLIQMDIGSKRPKSAGLGLGQHGIMETDANSREYDMAPGDYGSATTCRSTNREQ